MLENIKNLLAENSGLSAVFRRNLIKEYLQTLEALCVDGYLKIAELIPVPEDFTGYAQTRVGAPITDPSPFNHSTKIAVLEVMRKGK